MFLAPRVMFLILKSVIFLANSLVWTLSYNQVISHDANEHFYLCCISLLLMPLHFTVGESIENFLIPGALPFFPQFFFFGGSHLRQKRPTWMATRLFLSAQTIESFRKIQLSNSKDACTILWLLFVNDLSFILTLF